MKCAGLSRSCFKWLQVALLLTLTACVTTEESVFSAKKSASKALNLRIQIAISYLQEGNIQRAKMNIKEAQDLNGHYPKVYDVYGLIYEASGEYKLAEQKFRKMLDLDKNYSAGRNNYAVFLFNQKRYEEAIEQLQIVVEDVHYEKRPNAYGNLGLAAIELGKFKLAQEALSRAITMSRGNINTRYFIDLALLEYKHGDYVGAAKHLKQYRDRVKKSSPAALLLGIDIAEQFNDADAVASYALALRNLYPRSAEYLRYQQRQKAAGTK